MRKAGIGTVALALAWIISFLAFETASANHGHETLDVDECQAFQYVLEANDQLYLCRYNAVELEHATTSDDLGTSGLFLVIEEASSTVELASIPRMGFGLAGIYFSGDDLFAPTFATDTVDAYLTQNPSFFSSPDESARVDVTFNESTVSTDTQDLLTVILPQMLFRLEFDDPEIQTGTLISGSGITNAGRVYVTEAFEQLLILVPEAFNVPLDNVIPELGTDDVPILLQNIQAAGRQTYYAKGIESWGKLFGFGFTAMSLIEDGVILGFILFALHRVRKFGIPVNHKAAYFSIIPLLLVDAYTAAIGFDVFVVTIDMLFIFGAGMWVNRHIPG